jgi:hypothetical protein
MGLPTAAVYRLTLAQDANVLSARDARSRRVRGQPP